MRRTPRKPTRRLATRPPIEPLEPRRLLSATLFKDINPPLGAGSAPATGVNVDGTVYFFANLRELWRTDGTEAGTSLVAEIPGPIVPAPGPLTAFNHKLYFFSDYQLWSSDGTPAGTTLLKDFHPGPQVDTNFSDRSLPPANLTVSGGTLYFTAAQGLSTAVDQFGNTVTVNRNYELWKTDGTPEGTLQVADIYPGVDVGSKPSGLTDAGGTLYFAAMNASTPRLWRSSGTPETTSLAAADVEYPRDLTYVNNILFFTAGSDPFRGVYRLGGPSGGTSTFLGAMQLFPEDLVPLGDKLYFSAGSPRVLWSSDGTPAGTRFLTRSDTSLPATYVENLTSFNGALYFSGEHPSSPTGHELWRSDGTGDGTALFADLNPGPAGSDPSPLAAVAGTLFFTAATPAAPGNFWATNGTPAGTSPVNGFPDPVSAVLPVGVIGTTLLFDGFNDSTGRELFRTDAATAAPTASLVKDLNPAFTTRSSEPANPFVLNGSLLFTAAGPSGYELYRSDGTPQGTQLLVDLTPGPGSTAFANFTLLNDTLFFTANLQGRGNELWKTDGTPQGTSLVKDINPDAAGSDPRNLTAYNGLLYFFALDGNTWGLWKSDATPDGTTLVKPLPHNNNDTRPANLTAANSALYFTAFDNAAGYELWRSDGTGPGTARAADILPGTFGSSPSSLTPFNGSLYFAANGGTGVELWKFDGLTASLIADLNPGAANSSPANFLPIGPTLYFTATTPAAGRELWRLDGPTPTLVHDINPGPGSSNPAGLINYNGSLFFSATDADSDRQIWNTSPATAGATRFTALNPVVGSSLASPKAVIDGLLYFTGIDATGHHLFVTNGDPAHVVDATGLPGFSSFGIDLLIPFDGRIFSSGFQPQPGIELFTIDPPLAPPLVVPPGTLTLTASRTISSLSIEPGATLDLAGHSLLIDFPDDDSSGGVTLANAIRAHLLAGRIISSTAPASSRLAYALVADLPPSRRPAGADDSSLLITPALTGDANLDHRVNADDFALLDLGRLLSKSTWTFGDFNYDATINDTDAALLATAFAQSTPAAPSTPAATATATPASDLTPTPPTLPTPKPLASTTIKVAKSAPRQTPVTLRFSTKTTLPKRSRLHYAIDFNGDGHIDRRLTSRASTPLTLRHTYHRKGLFNLTITISTPTGQSLTTSSTPIRIR